MERRQLGNGVHVSRIILGCGNFGGVGSAPEFFGQGESDEQALELMDGAWELGITTFDTADAYGGGRSENVIGKWISRRGNRPEIATKTFNPMDAGADRGLGRKRVTRQLESSLDRLGVAHVERGNRRLEMLDPPWADDDSGHRRLGEQPGNRQRCRADPALGSRCGETFQADEGLLAEEVLVRPGPRAEPRSRRRRLAAAVLAAQQTARERPERRVADVELLAEREHFVLVAPLEK